MYPQRLLLLTFAFTLACGSVDSGPGPDPDPDPGADASLPDPDAGAVDNPDSGPAPCGTLAADPTEVFVDPRSTRDSVGTETCPFLTLDEAAALAAPAGQRTVHLAGDDPALTYEVAEVLVIRPGETLQGAGEDAVLLTGGGRCFIDDCVVSIHGGALAGVTVVSATGIAVEIPAGNDGSAITDVTARDSDLDGFYVRSSATLTRVTSINNGRDGLNARTGTVAITDSRFDRNDRSGIFADRQVSIAMTGGSVNSNDSAGIFLQDSSGAGRSHAITGVDLIQNLGFGINVTGTASLTLRDSVLRGNQVGVAFRVGLGNSLDLGTAGDPGGNQIGGATRRNIRSGLCIDNSGAAASQVAEGNSWQSCAPSQREITGPFCNSQNTYADVGFVPGPSGGAPPLAAPAACEVGD